MKTILICLLIMGGALGSKGPVNTLKPGGVSVLAVQPALSSVNWKAEKLTGSHTGTINIRSGSLTMYCGQLAKGSIVIGMNTLAVTDLTAPDKQKLETNLRGDNFFDTGKFPDARLDIISVTGIANQSNHQITVTANLGMHGITRKIAFAADVSKSTVTDFVGQADILLNRRDWNIATDNIKYNALIKTDIHLHVSLQAKQVDQQLTSR